MAQLKLIYFDFRGWRGEPVRLLLTKKKNPAKHPSHPLGPSAA